MTPVQGHIWREGFSSSSIKAELFGDVPDALVQWSSMGIKSYIYSSGSREAQNMLFGHTTAGDLRQYLCGFFDTRVGPKVRSAWPIDPAPLQVETCLLLVCSALLHIPIHRLTMVVQAPKAPCNCLMRQSCPWLQLSRIITMQASLYRWRQRAIRRSAFPWGWTQGKK